MNVIYHPATPEARAKRAMENYQAGLAKEAAGKPAALDALIALGRQAMTDYNAGLVKEANGRREVIDAVIKYGEVLLEGRAIHSNNVLFKQWVADNKLDIGKPWDSRIERTAAMLVATTVRENRLSDVFGACPRTRPNDIMIWYRKKHTSADGQKRQTPALKPHYKETDIEVLFDQGLDNKQIAKQTGIGERQIRHVIERIRIERETETRVKIEVSEEEALAAANEKFSEKSKLTVADAIRVHKGRLDKMFETKVGEEVRRHIAAADEAMRKQNAQLRKENLAITMLLQQSALFTTEEFKTILRCLHPDNSASSEVRARAFDIFRQKEQRLIGQLGR